MRFRLAAGERSSKYNPGQFVSAAYAARYPHKVATDEELEEEEAPEEPDFDYDWDISVEYEG